jgi:hypothetical protein
MDEKSILTNGFGSPGETTRALSYEFKKLRANLNRKEACRKVLKARMVTYNNLGFDVLDDALFERILLKGDGEFPFIVFADIFASNHNSMQDRSQAVVDCLDIVLEVIVDNYNKIVDYDDKCKNAKGLNIKAKEFINEELGREIFDVRTNDLLEEVWESAAISSEKEPDKWRKDGFGAWIYKDEYNKSTTYGWRIVTNQYHGKQLPFHWRNTERNKNGDILCKIQSAGQENVEYKKGCYIATVCYGSSTAHEVNMLREYRDQKLSQILMGKIFIELYYIVSPFIASKLINKKRLNLFIRHHILDKIVRNISRQYINF